MREANTASRRRASTNGGDEEIGRGAAPGRSSRFVETFAWSG
jgi:hypothetical protein